VCESWIAGVESHANRGHMTKTAIRQFSMAPAATLKEVFWHLGIPVIPVIKVMRRI